MAKKNTIFIVTRQSKHEITVNKNIEHSYVRSFSDLNRAIAFMESLEDSEEIKTYTYSLWDDLVDETKLMLVGRAT